MKRHRLKLGRIALGIVVFTLLIIIIVPKPQSRNAKTNVSPTEKVVVHNITLSKDGFEPKNITIKTGEVVIWTNKSGKQASVNSADHPTHKLFPVLNLGTFGDKESVQARIHRAGELKYHNHFDPTQTGTITVE